MALIVKSNVNGIEMKLEKESGIRYTAECTAPGMELKTTDGKQYFPVVVTAEDDVGNKTVDSQTILTVKNPFEFDFILADSNREEIGYLDQMDSIDVDIGDTNDFEMVISADCWDAESFLYGNLLYIPETEYGGIIGDLEPVTKSNEIYIRGLTWRGYLDSKILEPPAGENYLIVNGDVNEVISELIDGKFDTLFYVPDVPAGVELSNWKVDRYVSIYEAIQKFLDANKMRLSIKYKQLLKAVELRAVPVEDYSEQIEYSQDCNIDFDIRDYRIGVNHLICGGKGEGAERLILHLYVQSDGTIGSNQYYTGLAEISRFYDYNNAEDEKTLREAGIKKLKELQNYKKFEMSVNNIDLELGDIVGGREYITGTEMKKPVVQKIFNMQDGEVSIQYKLKGAD